MKGFPRRGGVRGVEDRDFSLNSQLLKNQLRVERPETRALALDEPLPCLPLISYSWLSQILLHLQQN